MLAEFISQPFSGQYDERSFDLDTVWKSSDWCWVKFTTDIGEEWAGSFRGKPVKTAIAHKINQTAILTSDSFYILDINKKEILFLESQTMYQDLIGVPTADKFLVADYYKVEIINKDFTFQSIDTEYDIDNIKFKTYKGKKLLIELKKMPEYNWIAGYIDTDNWTITIE